MQSIPTSSLSAPKKQTKTLRLYEQIKQEIREGARRPGERLPSKRDLAAFHGVSIMTVENALHLLEEEGFIKSVPRSGFYVCAVTCSPSKASSSSHIRLLRDPASDPSTGSVPVQGIGRIMRRILTEEPDIMLRKPPHLGCAVLRNAIAAYLLRFRGMSVQPSNILIGSGAEYLYGILVQLLGRDQIYGIEDPSYAKIERVYEASGARIERLPIGTDGINEEALKKARATVLHVSPFHSYPSGVTASAQKRFSYLAWALTRHAIIIEDDFDSELTFFRKPLDTLFSLDSSGCVIYMNTFSKSIGPGMRIAYMILPDPLLDLYEQKLGFYSCTVPVFDQYVLAAFIQEGGFERHLGRVRRKLSTS